MISGREGDRERLLRGARISAEKKLEGFRLMNEMSDKVLKKEQKSIRKKLREVR